MEEEEEERGRMPWICLL